jgi:hypothetical protein
MIVVGVYRYPVKQCFYKNKTDFILRHVFYLFKNSDNWYKQKRIQHILTRNLLNPNTFDLKPY